MSDVKSIIEKNAGEYAAGFDPEIAADVIPKKGVSEDVVRYISEKNGESGRVLEFRLAALEKWRKMKEPHWALFDYPPIDYDDIYCFAQPNRDAPMADEKIRKTYERLGVPLAERKILEGQAVDAVVDSRSVATTYRDQLASLGIIFCPISAALREYPDLVWKYLGSAVPPDDNFFAALNSAVFSDGTFAYVPKGVKCPVELSSYFRLQAEKLGQFERTLIIADEGSDLSYREGGSAPIRTSYQIHSGVVEVIALAGARVKYSTVQNWYGGDEEGAGGIYNFVTKRGVAHADALISWTQLEVGSIKTWKYPSCVLKGDRARGEFYSVAITNRRQAADTGTKMIHIGRDTGSTIFSKGVALGRSKNGYRGLVDIAAGARGAKNYTKCDNLIIGDGAESLALPDIRNADPSAAAAHEAQVASISDEQLFYLASRGIAAEQAVGLLVNGFCSDVIRRLPAEFALEARELINISIEDYDDAED
ncbi:MAG: Fe-S cluster assembly protein SufB [Rickettsiales bacterium]|jgi:Fe-S cluster assembly protein SufB|nr:Fe-S cluster assembly protein SufB [Rickettsiales bacterium]